MLTSTDFLLVNESSIPTIVFKKNHGVIISAKSAVQIANIHIVYQQSASLLSSCHWLQCMLEPYISQPNVLHGTTSADVFNVPIENTCFSPKDTAIMFGVAILCYWQNGKGASTNLGPHWGWPSCSSFCLLLLLLLRRPRPGAQ